MLATNLARALQLKGHRVLLADADPQGTARNWRNAQDEIETPVTVGVSQATLDRDLAEVGQAFDFVVIDTAPRIDPAAALRAADAVLIPVRPQIGDVWASADVVELVRARQAATGGRPLAAFVVMAQSSRTRHAAEIGPALKPYGLKVLKARTGNRVAYGDSHAMGLSVIDIEPPSGRARQEMEALTSEVLKWLNANR